MAEAFHEAEIETNRYTPTAVKDALAELRARDNDQTAALFKVLAEIGEELGKTEFKSRVTELKKQMCARASLSARARGDVTRVVPPQPCRLDRGQGRDGALRGALQPDGGRRVQLHS